VPRFNNPAARAFLLIADGNTIIHAALPLDKSTLIGYVTWQQTSARVSIASLHKFLTATQTAEFKLGDITYSFTQTEFAALKDFADALRLGKSTEWRIPRRAFSLLDDVSMKTRPNEYGCSSLYTSVPSGSANGLTYHGIGDQYGVKALALVLRVNETESAISSHEALVMASGVLADRSLGINLPDMLLLSLFTGKRYNWAVGKNHIEVVRESLPAGQGYEVKFIIR
jgi:hypothetical protein